MSPRAVKRRNVEDEVRRPKKKVRKFKKQKEYHSSSDEDDDEKEARIARVRNTPQGTGANANAVSRRVPPVSPIEAQPSIAALTDTSAQPGKDDQDESSASEEENEEDAEIDETALNTALNMGAHDSEEDAGDLDEMESEDDIEVNDLDDLESEEDDLADEFDSDDPSEVSTTSGAARKKRHDPTAFATSISKILTTKLTTQKRSDPILSRSKTADEANKALADGKLETKARADIRAERRTLLERGRVKDVLGLETPGIDTGAIMEEEKRLKKTAQRGVVKLFNAVRAAQVKAEEAERATRAEGIVGIHKREERINEMSKEGFLDLISRGGKTAVEA